VGSWATHATAAGGTLGNYHVTYYNGSLAITAATANPVATGGTFGYDAQPHAGGCSVTGVNGEVLTGTVSYTPGPGVPTRAGGYTVTCSLAGNTNYGNASATAPLTISQKAASVTPATATKTYGTADPSFTGTLSGFVAADGVTAAYGRTPGETVAGSPYTISATLSPAAALGNYSITSNTAAFTITKATPVITWPTPAAVTDGSTLGATQLNATASVPGTFVYSPAAGTTLTVGAQPLSVTFTPTDTANYTTATGGVTLTVTSSQNTPTGGNVAVQPVDTTTGAPAPVSMTFSNVTSTGSTTVTTTSTGTPPPTGFKLGSPPTYFDINTTAVFSGPVTVCIDYSSVSYGDPTKLKMLHNVNGTWVDVTVSNNTTTHVICGSTTSFSPFAVFESVYSGAVQSPINANGSSIFSASRGAIPVKFTLLSAGAATCQLPPATIALTRTSGGTGGAVNASVFELPSDNGANFRISSCQYVYNLNAKALGAGTYRVDIIVNGVVTGSGVFGLQ
jgi:hypothetical protein